MEKSKNHKYDYVLMLQPTSPFRKAKHIEHLKERKDVGHEHPKS